MMDIGILLLVAALAGGCGYIGGRWRGAVIQASLKAKLESDTENFLKLLAERDQDYGRFKEQLEQVRKNNNLLQVEQDKALNLRDLQKEKNGELERQLVEFNEQRDRAREAFRQLEEERTGFRDSKLVLEAECKKLDEQKQELAKRSHFLEEKLRAAMAEKTKFQTEAQARDREALDAKRRLTKQEDINESAEFSLAQMRTARDEMAQRLAKAEGQLEMLRTLKETLSKPAKQAEDKAAQEQLKKDFTDLAGRLSG